MEESQQELEKPMKVYQGKALEKKIDDVLAMLTEQNIFMKGVVTTDQFESRIKSERDKTDLQFKGVGKKYDPYLSNIKWAGKIAIGTFITILVTYFVGISK